MHSEQVGNMAEPIRLLLVDDQRLIRDALKLIFTPAEGFEVVGVCGDGSEGVALAANCSADVVVMDMRMPNVDGAEAIGRMQSLQHPPPVLVLTTFDDDTTLGQALLAGASGFILKEAGDDE